MNSFGMNGEGESTGHPANSGSPEEIACRAIKMECACDHFTAKTFGPGVIINLALNVLKCAHESKNRTPYSCTYLCQMLTDFQNSFTILSSKH